MARKLPMLSTRPARSNHERCPMARDGAARPGLRAARISGSSGRAGGASRRSGGEIVAAMLAGSGGVENGLSAVGANLRPPAAPTARRHFYSHLRGDGRWTGGPAQG